MNMSSLLFCICLLFCSPAFAKPVEADVNDPNYRPCCSFPCFNRGICLEDKTQPGGFTCDCVSTGFTGPTCESRGWNIRGILQDIFKPSIPTLVWVTRRFEWFWWVINNTPLYNMVVSVVLQEQVDSIVAVGPSAAYVDGYPTLAGAFNMSTYARTLSQVPTECPRPMGNFGPKNLPDPDEIFSVIFERKGKFIPSKIRSNMMFTFFAQHFTHQLFQTDKTKPGFIKSPTHQIDMNQVYGHTEDHQAYLRSFTDGKFKLQKINGEEWPIYAKDAGEGFLEKYGPEFFHPNTDEDNFALGLSSFTGSSGLVAYSTMWMREHNRVCDVLKKQHPTWDDERLFQTARLINIAVNARVVLTDYVQHLSGFNIKLDYMPQLTKSPIQSNRVRIEYNHLYHWHALIPEIWRLDGQDLSHKEFFGNSSIAVRMGLGKYFRDLAAQPAGEVSRHNFHPQIRPVIVEMIKEARALRVRSLNDHRKQFHLPPHKTFLELTGGDEALAKKLSEWYDGDIEAVELNVGFWAEPTLPKGLTPETVTVIGAAYAVFGLLTLPIADPSWWRPSTFGGQVGWDIIHTTDTIGQIICRNIPTECPSNLGMKFPSDLDFSKWDL